MAVHFAPPRQAIRMRTAFFAFVYPPWEMGGKGEDDALAPDVEGASLSRASRNITAVAGILGAVAAIVTAFAAWRTGVRPPRPPDVEIVAPPLPGAGPSGSGDASAIGALDR